jgi:hypothetical protein
MTRITLSGFALIVFAQLIAGPAHAQAPRTWVSGVGDDANPCSRTAPCKTFAGAISKTQAGGEINCLDPGGFGAVTITKSITLDCSGTFGSIVVSGTNGIVVSGSGIAVTLRGISLDGLGGQGLSAIRALLGTSLLIENVHVFGFGAGGATAIDIEPNQATNFLLDIKDTTVNANTGGAILIKPTGGGTTTASLTRVNTYTSTFGVRAEDRAKVAVFHSIASNNINNGYLAVSASSPSEVNLVESVAASNATNGIATSGGGATIRLVRSTITDNGTGINTTGGGTVVGSSPGSTLNAGNATPGAPNGTAATLQ